MFTYRAMRFGSLVELPTNTIDEAVRMARADLETAQASPRDVVDDGQIILQRDDLLKRADPETYATP